VSRLIHVDTKMSETEVVVDSNSVKKRRKLSNAVKFARSNVDNAIYFTKRDHDYSLLHPSWPFTFSTPDRVFGSVEQCYFFLRLGFLRHFGIENEAVEYIQERMLCLPLEETDMVETFSFLYTLSQYPIRSRLLTACKKVDDYLQEENRGEKLRFELLYKRAETDSTMQAMLLSTNDAVLRLKEGRQKLQGYPVTHVSESWFLDIDGNPHSGNLGNRLCKIRDTLRLKKKEESLFEKFLTEDEQAIQDFFSYFKLLR
jgi:hypothetical protein